MNFFKRNETKRFLLKLLLGVLLITFYFIVTNLGSILIGINKISKIMMPFFYGFIIAYLLNIPCSWFEERLHKTKYSILKRKSRGFSVLFVYSIFVVIIIFTINKVIPSLQRNISDFILNFNTYYNNVLIAIRQLPIEDTQVLDSIINTVMNWMNWKVILEKVGLDNILSSLNVVFGLTSFILNAFIAIITSIYFLLETHNFKKYMSRVVKLILSEDNRNSFNQYVYIINHSFKKFIACQLLDSCILGTITFVEFSILGSKYAMALGVMLAVCNIIPYFGSIFGSIVAIIIVSSMNGIGTGAVTAIVLLITQQIDGNIIQPKLMGSSFSLSPALIVIGITIGGSIAGIWGMIFAIPVVNILKQIVDEWIKSKELSMEKESEKKKEKN